MYLSTPGYRTVSSVCSLRVPIRGTKTNKSIWFASLTQQVPLRCSLMLSGIRRELCAQLPCTQPIMSEWFLPLGQSRASHAPAFHSPPPPPAETSSHGCGQTQEERRGKGFIKRSTRERSMTEWEELL